ncbi:MAG: hypothetical protein ABSG68_02140 [Thermoguttaceae bacterium]|jgi:hypothetical protein
MPTRTLALVAMIAIVLAGCVAGPAWGPPGNALPVAYDNPAFVPIPGHDQAWEAVVDVVTSYFKIDQEEPVRLLGNTLTEGRIITYPKLGATLLEPWDQDSANASERVESTLQTMRRRAVLRIVPAQGGYWVDVAVFKELEDLKRPEQSTAGAATFPYDNTNTRVANPVGPPPTVTQAWIPQGRDTALEQRIIGQLHYHVSPAGRPLPL